MNYGFNKYIFVCLIFALPFFSPFTPASPPCLVPLLYVCMTVYCITLKKYVNVMIFLIFLFFLNVDCLAIFFFFYINAV